MGLADALIRVRTRVSTSCLGRAPPLRPLWTTTESLLTASVREQHSSDYGHDIGDAAFRGVKSPFAWIDVW